MDKKEANHFPPKPLTKKEGHFLGSIVVLALYEGAAERGELTKGHIKALIGIFKKHPQIWKNLDTPISLGLYCQYTKDEEQKKLAEIKLQKLGTGEV